ncbi:hypothetical protein CVIRNUC_008555 [Coccomyxa viridis]|uniref:Adenosine deaminase domain-containing protein n=1 Tax=Coccomyxa viridis TaxID=1274662 RepID=A0AAV1IDK7_9CHLO|nr:hypothetical protein CVIRNUC_008555 [Coccomyxa viridis]
MGSVHHTAAAKMGGDVQSVLRFLASLPKAELHLHIEGTLEPELMFELAQRNHALDSLPCKTLQEMKAAYNFQDLQSFLNLYYAGCAVLRTDQDFYDLTMAYLRRAKADNVVHTEIFFDPQTHTQRGVPLKCVIEGIHRAQEEGQRTLGITSCLILSFLRDLGPEAAMQTLNEAEPFLGHITGVGLDSCELGFPPGVFQEVFQKAKTLGLKRVAHAGEEGPAQYIWEALQKLDVQRIDHGVKCLEDRKLIESLEASEMPLTVCPLSNLELKVYSGELEKRMSELLSTDLCITINSDDPAYFGGYLNQNYLWLIQNLGLDSQRVVDLHANSFRASFLSQDAKTQHCEALAAAYKQAA